MTRFWKMMFMAMTVLSGGCLLLAIAPYVVPYGQGWRFFTALAVAVVWSPIFRAAKKVLDDVPTTRDTIER